MRANRTVTGTACGSTDQTGSPNRLRRLISRLTCGYCTNDPKKDMTREVVLITGSGSGLGRILALEFSKRGCRLVLWDVNTEGNNETAAMIRRNGGEAFTYFCDVSKRESIYETARRVKEEVGIVTILVNNAGIVSGKEFLKLDDQRIIKTFEVNVLAHFWTCKAFLPDMIRTNHGHIVSIASVAGLIPFSNLTDYSSSKFAAVGFQDSLHLELTFKGYDGIHSTIVCPFVMNTKMFTGSKTSLLNVLDPYDVARKTVKAVRAKKSILVIPYLFAILASGKQIVPRSVTLMICKILGAKDAMTNFIGHDGAKTTEA